MRIATNPRFQLIQTTYYNNHDAVDAARETFKAKVAGGSATWDDIITFILTFSDGYDYIPYSLGMDWMHRNADEFSVVVKDANAFVERVLAAADWAHSKAQSVGDRRHDSISAGLVLGREFFRGFIASWRLMRLLTPAMRERFVDEFYPRFGAMNNLWIKAALMNGVPRSRIASAIINRLRATKVEQGMANCVHDFLRHGAGSDRNDQAGVVIATLRRLGFKLSTREEIDEIFRNPEIGLRKVEKMVREREEALTNGRKWMPKCEFTPFWLSQNDDSSPEAMWSYRFAEIRPWVVLTSYELVEALEVCADKMPGHTINALQGEYAEHRLDAAQQSRVLQAAILKMTRLDGVDEKFLSSRLLLADRVRLAWQMEKPASAHAIRPLAQFLFRIVCDNPNDSRADFWEKTVVPLLKDADASVCYRAWRQMALVNKGVEKRLRGWLKEQKWRMGAIKRIAHPKGGTQMAVSEGEQSFVQARDSHDYFPAEGDEVLFRPESGRRLTPYVTAVYFTPVMKNE
jgi:hypothetical protein